MEHTQQLTSASKRMTKFKYIIKAVLFILIINLVLGLIISFANSFLTNKFIDITWYLRILYIVLTICVALFISELFDLVAIKFTPVYSLTNHDISNYMAKGIFNKMNRYSYLFAYRLTLILSISVASIGVIGIWDNYLLGDNFYSSIFLNSIYTYLLFKLAHSLIKLPKANYYGLFKNNSDKS
jgi:hypothetical protein